MPRPHDPSRDLLFGLLARQTGLTNQAQHVASCHAWTQATARSLAALAEAGRAGHFRDPDKILHLRADRDFDPLRARPDFQVLVMDLAMPDDPFSKATDADRGRRT